MFYRSERYNIRCCRYRRYGIAAETREPLDFSAGARRIAPWYREREALFSRATNDVIGSARDIETEFNAERSKLRSPGPRRFVTPITAS